MNRRATIQQTVIAVAWERLSIQTSGDGYKPIPTYRAGNERRPTCDAGRGRRARRARLCSSPARMQPYL
jgi:hypothetical protein